MTEHREPCDYRRTAIAIALWSCRKDPAAMTKLIEGSDNPQHVLMDQAIVAGVLLKTAAGNTEAIFTKSNLAEIAVSQISGAEPDQIASEISAAHLASAVLAMPQMAQHLCDDAARWASAPVAFFTCATAYRLAGEPPEGLLQQMAEAPSADALVDIVVRGRRP